MPVLFFFATSSNIYRQRLVRRGHYCRRAIVCISGLLNQGKSAVQLIPSVYLLGEAAPTDVSPIIKAVTDPFSLLALIVLVLGLIATKWAPRKADGKVGPRMVALSILVISLLAIALNIMRYINTGKPGVQADPHPLSI